MHQGGRSDSGAARRLLRSPGAPGVLVCLLCRLATLNRYYPSGDEAGFAAIARLWRSGVVTYGQIFLDRPPPLVIFAGAVGDPRWARWGFWLTGVTASAVMVACTVGVARYLGVSDSVRRAVGIVSGIALLHPYWFSRYMPNELYEAAFAAAAIWLLAREHHRARQTGMLPRAAVTMAAGTLAGLAFSMKQSGLDVLVAGSWFAVCGVGLSAHRSIAARVGRLGIFWIGAAVPIGPQIAFLGAGRWLWVLFGVRFRYASALSGQLRGPIVPLVVHAFASLLPTISWIVLAGSLGALATVRAGRRIPDRGAILVWWVSSVGLLVGGGSLWPSNFLTTLCPSFVLIAVLIDRICATTRRRSLFGRFVPIVFALSQIAPVAALATPNQGYEVDGRTQPNAEWAAAAYVRARTAPSEAVSSLFDLHGFELMVDRPLGQSVVFAEWLKLIPGSGQEFVRSIVRACPRFIAGWDSWRDQAEESKATGLAAFISADYREAQRFGSVIVFARTSRTPHCRIDPTRAQPSSPPAHHDANRGRMALDTSSTIVPLGGAT